MPFVVTFVANLVPSGHARSAPAPFVGLFCSCDPPGDFEAICWSASRWSSQRLFAHIHDRRSRAVGAAFVKRFIRRVEEFVAMREAVFGGVWRSGGIKTLRSLIPDSFFRVGQNMLKRPGI